MRFLPFIDIQTLDMSYYEFASANSNLAQDFETLFLGMLRDHLHLDSDHQKYAS